MSRIKYYNITTQKWEYADGLSGGSISEAPIDGKQYARKNGAWSEVESGGADLPKTKALLKGDGDGGALVAEAGVDYFAPDEYGNIGLNNAGVALMMNGRGIILQGSNPDGTPYLTLEDVDNPDESVIITGVAEPEMRNQAVNKGYVDDNYALKSDFVDIPYSALGVTPYTYSEIRAGVNNGKKYRVLAPHNSDTIICPLQTIAVNAHTPLIIFGSGIASIDMSVGKFDYEVVTLHPDNSKSNYHNYAVMNALGCAITDSGNYYTSTNVEGALAEIGAEMSGINTLIGSGVIT